MPWPCPLTGITIRVPWQEIIAGLRILSNLVNSILGLSCTVPCLLCPVVHRHWPLGKSAPGPGQQQGDRPDRDRILCRAVSWCFIIPADPALSDHRGGLDHPLDGAGGIFTCRR